jgi:hypothetical protein
MSLSTSAGAVGRPAAANMSGRYVTAGKQFIARYPDKKVKWYDAASNVFNDGIMQGAIKA